MRFNKLFVLSLLFILFSSCGNDKENSDSDVDSVSEATSGEMAEFSPEELTEYEGVELDSVNNFRENSISGVQSVDIENYRLEISGLVETPLQLSYNEVLAYESRQEVITIYCVEGWEVTVLWEGIPLKDIFNTAGVKPEVDTVVFYAADGYSTSLSLEFIMDNDLMIAYKANGIDLPENLGYPFILVAEEKWGYKWARWITGIELSDDPEYRGFWESRGYDNDADLSGSFWERD